jgi:hypothetical protein
MSAEFFLLNNILRDRVIDELPSKRLKDLMRYSKLKFITKQIYVDFPEDANNTERAILTGAIDTRIAASAAFAGLKSATYCSAGLIERFDKMMKLTRLDIKYSDKFTRDNWHRKFIYRWRYKVITRKSNQNKTIFTKTYTKEVLKYFVHLEKRGWLGSL